MLVVVCSGHLCRSQGRVDMVAFWKDVAAKVAGLFLVSFILSHDRFFFAGTSPFSGIMDEILAKTQT